MNRQDLRRRLRSHFGPADSLRLRPLEAGGASNPTHRLDWGDHRLMLRRSPAGSQTALDYGSLHRVRHEYRVMDALEGTDVPVPRVHFFVPDGEGTGGPYYVMERVAGETTRTEEIPRFSDPASRRTLADEYLRGMTRLHGLDLSSISMPEGVGLDPASVVRRCRRQARRATRVTARRRTLPRLEEIGEWLEDHVPPAGAVRIVHGDYKPDNLMLAPGTPPRLAAVLDWEMSGVGDPLTDLGWFLSYWSDPEDPDYGLPPPDFLPEKGFMEREGYPRRRELVERYQARTGLSYDHDSFYRTLGLYKLAVILEGFFARHLKGTADHELYPLFEELVPYLAAHAVAIVEGHEPL